MKDIVETNVKDIEKKFNRLTNRSDIAILLINQYIADMIRPTINKLDIRSTIPVIEIPSKDTIYDPNTDPLLRQAKKFCGGEYK
ncbi:Vacuolar proton pump subunit F [Intoshia linei]|uniref:Vacuolar proton pump subunit F n=1 Tax=Intoshia linei TaxID=1819745 RepID=A0A177B7M0_9BILA|nr:Vacuolar proton pump subunit F [Intoshia linei]